LDGAALEGDLLVDGAPLEGDGACEDGDDEDDDAPLAGTAAVCACAPVAAARLSTVAATTVCNLSI
jgi:hypothetical protein